MAYKIKTEYGGTVEVDDSPATKERVWNMLLMFYNTHGAYDGDSIMQSDDPQVEAPQTLANISEVIFRYKEED